MRYKMFYLNFDYKPISVIIEAVDEQTALKEFNKIYPNLNPYKIEPEKYYIKSENVIFIDFKTKKRVA